MILENIENFSSVFNIFLKAMVKIEGSGFINISNNKNDVDHDLINYDILYYSSLKFTSSFTLAFRKTHPNIKTINVITDLNKIKEDEEKEALCTKVFSWLGIKAEIRV